MPYIPEPLDGLFSELGTKERASGSAIVIDPKRMEPPHQQPTNARSIDTYEDLMANRVEVHYSRLSAEGRLHIVISALTSLRRLTHYPPAQIGPGSTCVTPQLCSSANPQHQFGRLDGRG